LALGGGVLAAGGAAGAWGLLARDGDTAATPPKGESPTASGGASRLVWKASVQSDGIGDTIPFPVGDDLALVSDAVLLCVDARTGKRRVERDLSGGPKTVLSDGQRLFALDSGLTRIRLVPVDLTTGSFRAPLAEFDDLDTVDTRLVVAVGRALILEGKTTKGWVRIAIDSRTGKQRWRRPMPAPPEGSIDLAVTPMGSSFLRTEEKLVSLIDARTGATRWSVRIPEELSNVLPGRTRHAISSGHLFLGASELLALRLSDGETAWRFGKGRKFGEQYEAPLPHYGPPILKDGVLYTAERDNGVIALEPRSGRLLWEEDKSTASPLSFAAAPAVNGKYFYASPDNDAQWIAAIDLRTHRVAWTFQSPFGDQGGVAPTVMALPAAKRLIVLRGSAVCALALDE
ncbi:PQQ-binding-like beta-propeller repeat protein, partial [Streptomyces botrytidirepellens]